MDILLGKCKAAYEGPFGPDDSLDAKHLIGKEVLIAHLKEALGCYATLLDITEGKRPYIVLIHNSSFLNDAPKTRVKLKAS